MLYSKGIDLWEDGYDLTVGYTAHSDSLKRVIWRAKKGQLF